jgi:UDP-glucose 4-epimerase
MNKSILITGGAGFIGHHLVRAWLAKGATVRVLDNLRTGHARNLEGLNVEFFHGSVTDSTLVQRAAEGVDVIHHFAAVVSVPESVEQPQLTLDVNMGGTLNVLDAAHRNGNTRVVLASSSSVYGNVERPAHRETDLPEPQSPYALTKLGGEHLLHTYAKLHGVGTVSLRYFNVYGPRQDPSSPYAAAIARFVAQAKQQKPLTIFDDGEQTRDFIHVQDVVAANLLAAERGEGVYNVGRNEKLTVNELAHLINQAAGSTAGVVHLPPRAGDVRHSRGNADRLMALGWAPRISLEQGIAELVAEN